MTQTLIIFTAQYLYVVIVAMALVAVACAKVPARKALIRLSALSLPLAFIVGKLLSQVVSNPRPFVVQGVTPLFLHGSDNGFPSDHTLLAMTIAAIIFTYNRKLGLLLGILGLLVGMARVLAKVHHSADVIGSIFIAFICVYLAGKFLSKVFKTYPHHQ